jgi:glycosyltransferase involved in cell wall biosynthesis
MMDDKANLDSNATKLSVLVGMPAPGSWGGPIYCEPPFVEALRRKGVDVDEEIYVWGESGRSPTVTERVGRVIEAARRLRRRVLEKHYDVVHLNTSFDEKCVLRDLTTMAMLPKGTPVFLKMHGSIASFLRSSGPVWNVLKRRVFQRASLIGVLSSEEYSLFAEAGCPESKLVTCKYVVEPGEFIRDDSFRDRHGLAESTTILLFSARFIEAKGLLVVIAATAELIAQAYDVVLFCLGDGPERVKAEAKVNELGIDAHVRFTGYIPESETTSYHANSDIFVLPTYHDEGFPLVLVKSLAAGLPIVTTKVRAAADHFQDGVNCIFVPPRDVDSVANAIRRLIDSPDLSATLSLKNLELAKTFHGDPVAEEYIQFYRSMHTGHKK